MDSFEGLFGGMGGGNESSGGIRTMIDIAQKHQMHGFGDLIKELMTNAPEGVTQLTKGPWSFNR